MHVFSKHGGEQGCTKMDSEQLGRLKYEQEFAITDTDKQIKQWWIVTVTPIEYFAGIAAHYIIYISLWQ